MRWLTIRMARYEAHHGVVDPIEAHAGRVPSDLLIMPPTLVRQIRRVAAPTGLPPALCSLQL